MLRGCVQGLADMLDELPVSDGCSNSLVTSLSEEQRQQLGRYIAGMHLPCIFCQNHRNNINISFK